jgi:uncharacterized membrane protein
MDNSYMEDTYQEPVKQSFGFQRLATLIGGSLLLINGLSRRSHNATLKKLVGGYLIYKGIAGNRSFNDTFNDIYDWAADKTAEGDALNIRTTMTINRPRHEVYATWRNLSNLSLFMDHLLQVTETDPTHSTWKAQLPGILGTVEWKAEIVKEREGEMIAWQSTEDSTIRNAGKVGFRDALGGMGTIVDVVIIYNAPMGKPGEVVAKMFTPMIRKMIVRDINSFKNFVEIAHKEDEPAPYITAIP